MLPLKTMFIQYLVSPIFGRHIQHQCFFSETFYDTTFTTLVDANLYRIHHSPNAQKSVEYTGKT